MFNKEEKAFIKTMAEMTLEFIDVAVSMGENTAEELAEEKVKANNILNKIKGFNGEA